MYKDNFTNLNPYLLKYLKTLMSALAALAALDKIEGRK